MRAHGWLSAAPLLVISICPARGEAQVWSATSGASRSEMDRLKEELREQLKDELKAEIKQELQQEGSTTEAPKGDQWAEEEWKWEEPVKPELNFLELDGYFRFRYELFKHLDLGTTYVNTVTNQITGPFAPGFAPPTPLCNLDVKNRGMGTPADPSTYIPAAVSCANKVGHTDTLSGANMRLRLEPVFNVYEDIKIKMQIDVLDNVVLGSTPDAFPGGTGGNPSVPLAAFSRSQLSPSDGINALTDSIRVKRAWAEIGTPLGQIRVGRMPSHFGMGILVNEGKGLEANSGSSADRIMFATKISDFYIIPAYDWVAVGPTNAQRIAPGIQPLPLEPRADVEQFIIALLRRDKDQEIKEKLENDELVLNYGTYQVYRRQFLDVADYWHNGNPDPGNYQGLASDILKRNAWAWIYSFWFKLLWRKLSIEAEYAGIVGKINNPTIAGMFGTTEDSIDLLQQGAAVNAEYKLLRDSLTISFLAVFASGDQAPGWGINPFSNPAVKPGDWDGSQALGDHRITNFRFDPSFYVDYIFWRQLVGQITDAIIVRPGVQYNLTEGFGARLDVVYSHAIYAASTPSASRPGLGLGQASGNLGVEGDLKVFYNSEDGFHAWLVYGLFVPFIGLNHGIVNEMNMPIDLSAGVAHTLQGMLAVTF
jgi:uncharacterized protein (TIGR04551 family)